MIITKIYLPVKPVPASRVKVTRWGSFYTKTYTDFRGECYHVLNKIKSKYPANDSCYAIHIDFIHKRPMNPSNIYPVGDLDNLLKGPLDALVKCGIFLIDDIQIIDLSSKKRYQRKGEDYGMHLTITEYSREESIELLS